LKNAGEHVQSHVQHFCTWALTSFPIALIANRRLAGAELPSMERSPPQDAKHSSSWARSAWSPAVEGGLKLFIIAPGGTDLARQINATRRAGHVVAPTPLGACSSNPWPEPRVDRCVKSSAPTPLRTTKSCASLSPEAFRNAYLQTDTADQFVAPDGQRGCRGGNSTETCLRQPQTMP
jgi:hypothetical protein